MDENKFSCYLIGADTLLTQCGEILLSNGHSVLGVISDAPRALSWAKQQGLEVLSASSDYSSRLQEREFDYLFAITHLAIIPDAAVESPRKMAVNFHDGPLPSYAGLNTPMWAIINGESSYGISWHVMSTGIDTGDLLVQQNFDIAEDETALSLNTKCFAAALDSFPTLISQLASGSLSRRPQNLSERSYFGRKDKPGNCAILDWQKPAIELERLVRGLDVGNYDNLLAAPKVLFGDVFYIVTQAEAVDTVSESTDTSPPGSLLSITSRSLEIKTTKGSLIITALRSLTGEDVTVTEAVLDIGLREGLELPNSTLRQAEEWSSHVATAESKWLRTLSSVQAPDLPYRRTDAVTDGAIEQIRLTLPDLSQFGSDDSFAEELIAAAVLIFLSRLRQGESVYPAFELASSPASPEITQHLCSDIGFLEFSLDPDAPVGSELSRAALLLRKQRRLAPWLKELAARIPAIGRNQLIAGDRALPLALEFPDIRKESAACKRISSAELAISVSKDGMTLRFDTGAYHTDQISALCRHFNTVVEAMLKQPDLPGRELELISQEEKRQLLESWNETDVDYDRSQTIFEAFSAQADRSCDAIALVANGEALSYRELHQRVEQMAAHLQAMGVGPDALVGVHLPRSIDLLVATLGILRAGGAYVPLDPAFPAERLAFMIEDSRMSLLISTSSIRQMLPESPAKLIEIESLNTADDTASEPAPAKTTADDLAYVIYTSGSTGVPKGVMLEHRNVINFFTAMDERVPGAESPGTWLAVTSLSFDISVLELIWTLTRGFKVVVYDESKTRSSDLRAPTKPLKMGLFMWGNDDAPGPAKYRLLMEGSKYFDQNGFDAVWTPERHFHAFGGPYPNPAVTGAAVAAVTDRIKIRAGSCVVPLHHPLRIAEEWSVVDNLSNGRVEIAAASGWNPNDFILKPENHANNKQVMFDQLEQVRALWRGDALTFPGPIGDVAVQSLPRPVQSELPCWITTAGNPETWKEAGRLGLNVLTHLLGQTVDEVSQKIQAYREARREAGFDPDAGQVALMLHTFVGDDNDHVRELVREPMKSYLSSSMKLAMDFAWSFPAFKRPGGEDSRPEDIDLKSLSDAEVDTILNFAFERYFETSGLFGDETTCAEMLRKCANAGVDEIACLLDFGVDTELVMQSLPGLKAAKEQFEALIVNPVDSAQLSEQQDFASLVTSHSVTHMQCTPSTARMLLIDDSNRAALATVKHVMVGGEALPVTLAQELTALLPGTLTNMYGPTETTIWSTTAAIEKSPSEVTIGQPIANTRVYVLDEYRKLVPPGMPGELYIGGDGVARGYFARETLTRERFVDDPYASDPDARMYATGDLVRFRSDGNIEYLGRTDFQVKVRGYRIELGEVEYRLEQLPQIGEAAVVVKTADDGDQRMIAYLTTQTGDLSGAGELRDLLRQDLPDYMIPNEYVPLVEMPRTANGKLDRKALVEIQPVQVRQETLVAPENETETQIAQLWCRTLKLESVGVNENFFDLGGHSLLVVQLHKELKEIINTPVSLTDLYQYPSIRALSDYLTSGSAGQAVQKASSRGEKRRSLRNRRKAS